MKNIKPQQEDVISYITTDLYQELTNIQFKTSIKHITDSGILIKDNDGYDVHIGLWHIYVEILQYDDINNTKENLKIVENRMKILEDIIKNRKA
ncbi:hypothetical protein H1230_06920 [Paenibacillus sp. 19GGS1-52]|uniref:hypothetical protein n=1 Tax=Paenibacillus sp. 19GGS1-52 TaxID=2758563 RepID=UPI001EFB2F73|nr:hypothetical protein [Paenibacillus sp. 19GGS1-52]ULO08533.1 hypothetical protein H1230_06920 [Paenibacillus sp. 19GGS1-52]